LTVEKRNICLFILSSSFQAIAVLSATGAILQTFLYSVGFTQNQIYIQSTVYQGISTFVILLFSSFADKGNMYKRTFGALIVAGFALLGFLPLCLMKSVSELSLILLFVFTVVLSSSFALHTVCIYKLPYYIFTPDNYGPVNSLIGILSSLFSFIIGAIMTGLSSLFEYAQIMNVVFLVSSLLLIAAAILALFLKHVSSSCAFLYNEEDKSNIKIINVFKHPSFYSLIPANLLRGFASGTIGVIAVIASDLLGYTEETTTAIVSVQSVAVILGCLLFGTTARLISSRMIILIGSLTFLCFPLILIPNNPMLFLLICAIINFGRTLVDYAVPTVLLRAVPSSIAGPYNAWRMALHSFGGLISTTIAVFISTKLFITLTIIAQLFSGLSFFLSKELKKNNFLVKK